MGLETKEDQQKITQVDWNWTEQKQQLFKCYSTHSETCEHLSQFEVCTKLFPSSIFPNSEQQRTHCYCFCKIRDESGSLR
jgi:hypothetical protein